MKRKKKITIKKILLIIFLILFLIFIYFINNKENVLNFISKTNNLKAYKASSLAIGDIVYYDHRRADDPNNESKLSVTLKKGSPKEPGTGHKEEQTFSAGSNNTTWRVWEKLSDGRVILIANKVPLTVKAGEEEKDNGDVEPYIWAEHNINMVSSIFGYGFGADTNATLNYAYKVGSKIEGAPDMSEGDRGNWKIGVNGINVSGARSLTRGEVERKLGINDYSIAAGSYNIKNSKNSYLAWATNGPYYNEVRATDTTYVPQRDINSPRQIWDNRALGKARNSSYRSRDNWYEWALKDVPNGIYKKILTENIDNYNVASSLIGMWGPKYSYYNLFQITTTGINPTDTIVGTTDTSGWTKYKGPSIGIRPIVYLKSGLDYYKATDEQKAWDIIKPEIKQKRVEVNVPKNLTFTPKIVLTQGSKKVVLTKENDKFVGNIEYEEGKKRYGKGDNFAIADAQKEMVYKVDVENLPSGYIFNIKDQTVLDVNFEETSSINLEIQKENLVSGTNIHSYKDLKIGDVVYYNHKKSEKTENADKLNVQINKGDALNPGSGNNEGANISASNQDVKWRVWDINNKTGYVTLIGDSFGTNLYQEGGIGYIWLEHNLHQIASTFGYGYGAEPIGNKNIMYKVGANIINTNDTANWYIGKNGINISGSRALTLKEAEEKLGLDEQKIKSGYNQIEGNEDYGNYISLNLSVPQRDNGDPHQKWMKKEDAMSNEKNVIIKDTRYNWAIKNIPESLAYKNLLFPHNYINYQFASKSASFLFGSVTFEADKVGDDYFKGYGTAILFTYDQEKHTFYGEKEYYYTSRFSGRPRVLTVLKRNLPYYKATDQENAWDLQLPTEKTEDIKIKINNLTKNQQNFTLKFGSKDQRSHMTPAPSDEQITLNPNTNKEQIKNVKTYSGIARIGQSYSAIYSESLNNYNILLEGINENSEYKVMGLQEGELDISKEKEVNITIYPKNSVYSLPVEYSGGKNDPKFSIKGKLKLMNGEKEEKSLDVVLEPKKDKIEFNDVKWFDEQNNKLIDYDVKFEKNADENNLHEVIYKDGKIIVTYKSPIKKIKILTQFDKGNSRNLKEMTVTLISKVGNNEKREDIKLLENLNFNKTLDKPEKNEDGDTIEYSLIKKSLNLGYVTDITKSEDGFVINLKALLPLPFTGSKGNLKNIGYYSAGILFVAILFRVKKRVIILFKKYKIMN